MLSFFVTEIDFGREICQTAQERDRKARSKKASFTFDRDPRPKARKQNFAIESRRWPIGLGKCQGYRKEV